MSTPHVTNEPPMVEKLSVELLADEKRWLELEALRMKHERNLARPSMSLVISEALREYRLRREQEPGQ